MLNITWGLGGLWIISHAIPQADLSPLLYPISKVAVALPLIFWSEAVELKIYISEGSHWPSRQSRLAQLINLRIGYLLFLDEDVECFVEVVYQITEILWKMEDLFVHFSSRRLVVLVLPVSNGACHHIELGLVFGTYNGL